MSNVKEEVYGALDSFIAWDLEFPLITVKKALKILLDEKDWTRVIQVLSITVLPIQVDLLFHNLIAIILLDDQMDAK